MLDIEDTLNLYGFSIEDASNIEEEYYEYSRTFTDNRIYQKVVSELKREIFGKFCSSDEDVAKGAYHEMQGLLKIMSKLQNIETAYDKVQAIKDTDSN